MKFGVCIGEDLSRIQPAKQMGFDYIESCFPFVATSSDEVFENFCNVLESNDIKCEAVNLFMPGSLPIVGDEIDYDAINEYLEKGFSRGAKIGLKSIVFGSGGSRGIKNGYNFSKACQQISYFLKEIVAPYCEKYKITVAIEPLNYDDCNILNTVKECVQMSSTADCEYIKGLVDLFHFCKMNEGIHLLNDLKGCIYHAHIAEPVKRIYPMDKNAYDYKKFIDILEEIGCERCSIEADTFEFEKEGKLAIDMLRSL
ncbi:MAG: TIM barrel protein [Clostridia bacterium]|nr:TIM barrel protein [Clostridia bacterium]